MSGLPLLAHAIELGYESREIFGSLEQFGDEPVRSPNSVRLQGPQLAGEDGGGVTVCL